MATHIAPATKVSENLRKMLNDAIAKEIAVSIQYMWQHVQVIGVKGIAVQGHFKQTAITEMKHAEKIAERFWYLWVYVIKNRIMADEPLTLQEIGNQLKLSKERVRQIESEALKKLKKEMSRSISL